MIDLWRKRKSTAKEESSDLDEGQVVIDAILAMREGLAVTQRLVASIEAGGLDEAERSEARDQARELAIRGRIRFYVLRDMGKWTEELSSAYGICQRIIARLAYCLHALSGADPEPMAVLSSGELETLFEDEDAYGEMRELLATVPADLRAEVLR